MSSNMFVSVALFYNGGFQQAIRAFSSARFDVLQRWSKSDIKTCQAVKYFDM